MVRILFEASIIGYAQADVLARTGIYNVSSQLLKALRRIPGVDISLAYQPCWHEGVLAYLRAEGMADLIGKPPYAGPEPLHVLSPYYGMDIEALGNPAAHDWQIVHDLLPVLYPELFPPFYERDFTHKILGPLRPQTQVVCVSEHTRRDFLSLYPGSRDRTHVNLSAADARFFRTPAPAEIAATLEKYGIPPDVPYVLSVGTLEPRKNMEAVIDGFAAYLAGGGDGVSLVLTGAAGWGSEQLQRRLAESPELRERVTITGYVDDDDLPCLYAGALAFFYMSFYEGFGLPPLEAMACGCPVVTSDRSSLPEVVGDAGFLLDPNDIAGIARLIGDFRSGREDRAVWAERARRRAATFSWDAAAARLVDAMRALETVKEPPPPVMETGRCRVCGAAAEVCFGRAATQSRPARRALSCTTCGSLSLVDDAPQTDAPQPGDAAHAIALIDRVDAALHLCRVPRTEAMLATGADELPRRLLRERGYDAVAAADFAETVLLPHFERIAEPRAALAEAAAHRPDVIVLDAPLWDRTAPDTALADLSDTVRALPSLFGLQTLAAEIGYRVHSNGGLHLLTRDPPRKLALKTIAEMAWKFASEEYFGEAVKATRARRTEQAALWRRRAQGADAAEVRALRPLPRVRRGDGRCRFVIEGSFYHLSSTSGIARVWANIFAEWRKSGFLDRVVLLDRAGTAPPCEGLARIVVEPHHYSRLARDPALMQAYCDDLEAAAFCSTYYARPLSTPTMALIHDMIPEVLGFDLEAPMWREKHGLIRAAARFVCVSENTRRDLLRVFPEAAERPVAVASPAIAPEFLGPMPEGADALLRRHALDRDYLVFLGSQTGYKGADVLVEAVARLPEAERPLVVFVGDGMVQPRFIDRLGYVNVRGVSADDRDLRLLLSNALAYVNPSYYEGFGLPLLEAMASGCPVIAANAGAMPEVAGDAAILFQPGNPEALAEAIRRVSDLRLSSRLVMSGYERVEAFSWDGIAAAVRTALEEIADGR